MLSVDQLEDKLIDLAFAEDIGDGDHTTLCCIPEDAMGKSHLLIKEDGVLAGVEMAKKVFARFDPTMKVEVLLQDGTHVKKGDIAMIVEGKTRIPGPSVPARPDGALAPPTSAPVSMPDKPIQMTSN